jgi:hypothetical protein
MQPRHLLYALLPFMIACRHDHKSLSFYYWKTQFSLNEFEKKTLTEQKVQKLYVRFFDVDQTGPISPIQFNDDTSGYEIVPVIYIKNRTFERSDTTLAKNVFHLVSQIRKQNTEIQFDCDWTATTKDKYFEFIRQYKQLSKQTISCTIRLHQVKYKQRTGIPPADHGVLMYYNMGEINTGTINSIYEKDIASRYNRYIKSYPLPLDIALPIFSWGYIIRQGKVVQLLNKINFSYFKNDSNFTAAGANRFLARQACFKAGYYFQQNDTVKLEHVPEKDLLQMTKEINNNSGRNTGSIILYDLDSSNIAQYDKDIFEKILGNID